MTVLFVSVLRPAEFPDCTNSGLSSMVSASNLFMDCTREEALHWCNEHGKNPGIQFFLVGRELWGEDHAYAEPLVKPAGKCQCFGGNFLYTSDSRMYRTGGTYKLPIPIHDRFETYAEFEALCR